MTEKYQFHHLTFVTKYSRFPKEEIALKRYNAMMEIGYEAIKLHVNEYQIIWDAFNKQANILWIKIIAGAILPDHIHIIIDCWDKLISEIVNKLKWYSAYTYNKIFQKKGSLRAKWYSDTFLDNENHLISAIEYIKNNHLKHQVEHKYVWWSTI